MTDWQRPEGMPTLEHVLRACEQLKQTLAHRGLEPDVNPVDTNYQLAGLITALMQRGLVTADEVDYFGAVVELQSLQRDELASRPKPRIIVPGRD